MLTALAALLRAIGLACRGHRAVALENLALRQQLRALKHRRKRPTLRSWDRLFWMVLAKTWRDWRTALVGALGSSQCCLHADRSRKLKDCAKRSGRTWRALVYNGANSDSQNGKTQGERF